MAAVTSPPDISVNAVFKSWAEFQYIFKKWCLDQNVEFVIESSKPVGWINQRLRPGEKKYGEHLKYKYLTYVCKQGMARESKSTGQRHRQRTLKKNCPARLKICADQGNPQTLRISVLDINHEGHPVCADHVRHLPERRRLNADEIKDVQNMDYVKGKTMRIADYLRLKTGKAVTSRDVSNIKQKLKRQKLDGKSEVEDVLKELDDLRNSDPGGRYVVGYETIKSEEDDESSIDDPNGSENPEAEKKIETKEISYIYIQTSEMRKNVERFPEIIGMDTTYQLNKNNMHLSVMQCVDNKKRGRVVAYCFMKRETKDTLKAAINHFKNFNEDAAAKVETVLVDKDYKEISGVNEILPNARVHLCQVHVMRTFKKELKGVKNKKEIISVLRAMTKSENKEEFHKQYQNLVKICSEDFKNYFDKNWKEIDESWILYVRNESLNLGIFTTNHNESHNDKIKSLTAKCMTLGECIRSLLLLQRSINFECSHADFTEVATTAYITNNDSPEVADIFKEFGSWPANLLLGEWNESNIISEIPETLQVTSDSCSCSFFNRFRGLNHCKHLFWMRRENGLPILDLTNVTKRWRKLIYESNEISNSDDSVLQFVEAPAKKKPNRMLQTERYKETLDVAKDLAEIISQTGGKQFEKRLKVLTNLLNIYLSGREAECIPEDSPRINTNDDREKSKLQNEEESDTFENEEVGIPETPTCTQCKKQLKRHVANRERLGNKGRFYLTCPHGCHGVFRWYRCPWCDSSNVREDHRCASMPPGADFSLHEEEVASSSPVYSDEDTASGGILYSDRVENSEVPSPTSSFHSSPGGKDTETSQHSLSSSPASQHISVADSNDMPLDQDQEIEDEVIKSHAPDHGSAAQDFPCDFDLGIDDFLSDDGGSFAQPINNVGGLLTLSNASPKVTQKTVNDYERWQRGQAIDSSDVTQTGIQKWEIKSRRNKKHCYVVTKKTSNCSKCQDIYLCPHRYVCDCPDRSNPCKHIYKVHSLAEPLNNVNVVVMDSNSKTVASSVQYASASDISPGSWGSFVLPQAQTIKGRPNSSKTRTIKAKITQNPSKATNMGNSLPPSTNHEGRSQKSSLQRSCLVCEQEGPPTSEGGHKCCVCSKPVHNFGCSTTVDGSEEGFGKSGNICWSCFDNGGSSGSRNILTESEHGLAEKESVVIDLTSDDDEVFSAGGLPVKKEDDADFSSQAVTTDALSMPWKVICHPKILSEKFECRGITLRRFDFMSIIEEGAFITETIIDVFSLLMEDEASNEFAEVFTVCSSALINTVYGVTSYLNTWSASPCYFNDIWVIPSSVNINHWILILVFIRQKFIVVLDPLYGPYLSKTLKEQLQVVQYLLSCTYKYCTQQTINWDEWRIFHPKDFPRQPNGYDCAVYVSMFLFSLMKGVKLEKKNFSAPSLAQFRKFLSNTVLEKSAVFSAAPPPPPVPEMASHFYNEADKAIAAGTLIIDRPWREVPPKTVEDNLPTSTLTFLSMAMANICLATDKVCGAPAPSKCRVKGYNKMYLCEICREWYHKNCIGDNRPVPPASQPYICSLHEFAMTKTRYIRKPARQRISLG